MQATPQYLRLASDLRHAIQKGVYTPGSELPGQSELCREHQASADTVRRALRVLREAGMVRQSEGPGALVVSTVAKPYYTQKINTVTDLFEYGAETRFEVLRSQFLEVSLTLAGLLKCPPGDTCIHHYGIRYDPEFARPVCSTQVYQMIDTEDDRLDPLQSTVFYLPEALNLTRVKHVEQRITAVHMNAEEAQQLGQPPDAAALRAVRRYYDTGERLLLVSVSTHPGTMFRYSNDLTME